MSKNRPLSPVCIFTKSRNSPFWPLPNVKIDGSTHVLRRSSSSYFVLSGMKMKKSTLFLVRFSIFFDTQTTRTLRPPRRSQRPLRPLPRHFRNFRHFPRRRRRQQRRRMSSTSPCTSASSRILGRSPDASACRSAAAPRRTCAATARSCSG